MDDTQPGGTIILITDGKENERPFLTDFQQKLQVSLILSLKMECSCCGSGGGRGWGVGEGGNTARIIDSVHRWRETVGCIRYLLTCKLTVCTGVGKKVGCIRYLLTCKLMYVQVWGKRLLAHATFSRVTDNVQVWETVGCIRHLLTCKLTVCTGMGETVGCTRYLLGCN